MSEVLGLAASENHFRFPVHIRKLTSPINAVVSTTYSPWPLALFIKKAVGDGIFNAERKLMNGVERGMVDERLTKCAKCAESMECTECLGFESLTMKSTGDDSTIEDVATAARVVVAEEDEDRGESGESSRMQRRRGVVIDRRSEKEREEGNIFPPLLTTLNENGRPIFNLKKVSRDGRLVIYMLKNVKREIVRFVESDGRVTMQLLEDDSDDERGDNDDVDDEEETESGSDDGGESSGGRDGGGERLLTV
ncbi:hypothetical protein Ancab_021933 [Ancistrocladus abbreviatus]